MVVKRSPGRPPIPRDRIIDAAVQIVDEQGADALSMRALAQALDSGTATLYRHFANRDQLISHVVDHLFGEVEFDADELSALGWRQVCKSFAQSMFDVLRGHRNVAPLLVGQVPVGPNALAWRERLIAILLDNGFPPQLAARSYATVARYVLGFGIQLTDHSRPENTRLATFFRGLDPGSFPATVSVAEHLPVPLDDEFAFGLELIIDGLARQRKR